jgi:hypothetical protein
MAGHRSAGGRQRQQRAARDAARIWRTSPSTQDARELLEDLADAAAARHALAEPGESVPWEQVRAEAGL